MTTENLFRLIAEDNKDAFNTLFREWYERLCRFARHYLENKEDVEEVVSDVFVALWHSRTSLADVAKADTYLFVAVKNRCYNLYRKTVPMKITIEEQAEIQTSDETPEQNLERAELYAKLDELVNALPEQRRIIFQMTKEDGLTAKQTAEILNLSVRTVESQIYKAIKTLEKEITSYLGYSPRNIKNPKLRKEMLSLFL